MDTLALDLDGILAEPGVTANGWQGLPEATDMGHVHLHVADLAAAEHFYLDILGLGKPFDNTVIPSASFVSAGGYHHHVGMNTWAGVGAPPPPANAARLLEYEIVFPDQAALEAVLERLAQAKIPVQNTDAGWQVKDPSQNPILLRLV